MTQRRYQICVSDQGIGIKGDANKLFGHMFKVLNVRDNVNQNGIGFGLTISKMIIERLGGILMIKTKQNVSGVQVIIEFPEV